MPLALKVQTQLDERSLSDVRSQAQNVFDGIGRDAGQGFTGGLTRELDNIGPSFLRMGSAAEGAMSGISAGAAAAAVGVAGIALAAVKVGEEFYALGARFDSVFDSLTIQTGKVGGDLDALTESVKNVAANSASSFEEIGRVVGSLSQSFGDLSGQPLEDLTKQIADLNRMTGQALDIREFGQALRGFGEDSAGAAQALDQINFAAVSTGIPLDELLGTLQNVGPAARTLGLDMNETAGLITSFEKAGLDSSRMLTGLTSASNVFADSGINMQTGLQDTILQIREFQKAGDDAAATALAKDVFGARSAQLFLDAIRQGTLTVDTLNTGLSDTGTSIADLDAATSDWGETWDKLKNKALDALEPISSKVYELTNALGQLLAGDRLDMGPASYHNPDAAPLVPLTPGDIAAGTPPGAAGPGAQVPGLPSNLIMPALTGPPTPAGNIPVPSPTTPGQDIAGQLADQGGASGAKVALPLPAGFGDPPLPGESLQDWRQRQSMMEAQHSLAESQATLTKLEQDNATSEEDLIAARNDVAQARARVTAVELAGTQQEKQAVDAQVAALPGQGAAPRPGQTAESYGREQAALEASHKRLQAEAELQAVQADASSTQEDLTKAQNALTDARQSEFSAVLRLNESSTSAAGALDDIGVKLDRDFGLSKGLPGLADNLVRFIGSLAAAPLLGPLAAISNAQGGIDKTGSGLIGIAASQGAFGPQYMAAAGTTGGYQMPGPYSGPVPSSAMGPAGIQPPGEAYGMPAGTNSGGFGGGGASFPAWVNQVATAFGIKPSTYPGHQESDRSEAGYAPNPGHENRGIDWTGPVENLQKFADYLKTIPQSLEQVIYQNPNTGASTEIAGGRPQPGYFAGDLGGHQDHVHTRQSAAIPLPGQAAATGSGMNWDALAQAEAGGNWQINTGNGYSGGLQFDQSTWDAYKPPGAPSNPAMATKDQQIAAGQQAIAARGGPQSLWPNTYGALQTPAAAPAGPPNLQQMLLGGPGFAKGGSVGPTDTVPAMLTPGEFVVNQRSASRFGPLLHHINGFQGGGEVPPIPPPPPPPPPQRPTTGVSAGANIFQHLPPGATPGVTIAPGPPNAAAAAVNSVSPIGGKEAPAPPGGGQSGGGLVGAATGAASMAADMFAPGSGAAVQIASQEIQRAIKFGAQVAGIGVGGLMQTFLPFGGSDLANNNWITRIAGSFAGVAPQIPNLAGKAATVDAMQAQPQQPAMMKMPAPPISSGQGAGPPPGPAGPQITNNIILNNNGAANDPNTNSMGQLLTRQYETQR